MAGPQLADGLLGLLLVDEQRRRALELAEQLQQRYRLPQALLAAGFVRNCVWDSLHEGARTPLNDVDVVYFDPQRLHPGVDALLERRIGSLAGVNWDVKNQARLWRKHRDPIYQSVLDAMRYWPERETAVGICLDGSRRIVSAYGLASLFAGHISPGPLRDPSLCHARARQKGWLRRWPKLRLCEP